MSPMMPRDSSETEVAELEALCDRLGGFDARVSLEWLDGCMAALLAGPVRRAPAEWLPRLLGDAWQRTFADPVDVAHALWVIGRRFDVLADQLDAEALFDDPDVLRLAPLIGQYTDEMRDQLLAEGKLNADDVAQWPLTGEPWASAFLEAIDTFAEDWPAAHPDDEDFGWFEACMAALLALTERDAQALQADLRKRYPGQTLSRDELIDEACLAVQDLRCYWVDHAPRPPPRRVEAGPGRNDPCPCGSGRKYKKCHGAG